MSNTYIIYVSKKSNPGDPNLLRDIAITSSRNNQLINVTGMLMGVGQYFFQVLEGPEETLENLLKKIANDNRHYEIVVLFKGTLENRIFGHWNMACVEPSANLEESTGVIEQIKNEIEKLTKENGDPEKLKNLIIQIPRIFLSETSPN